MNSIIAFYCDSNRNKHLMSVINSLFPIKSFNSNLTKLGKRLPIIDYNHVCYSQIDQGDKSSNNNSRNSNSNPNDKQSNSKWLLFIKKSKYSLTSLCGIMLYYYKKNKDNEEKEIFYNDIFRLMQNKEIDYILLFKDNTISLNSPYINNTLTTTTTQAISHNPSAMNSYLAKIYLKNGLFVYLTIANYDKFINDIEGAQIEHEVRKEDFVPIKITSIDHKANKREIIEFIIGIAYWGLVSLICSNFAQVFFRSKGINFHYRNSNKGGLNPRTFTDSKAREFIKGQSNIITLKDVAGLREAKKEITEFIDFLKNPSKYHSLGAKIPHGALLIGPPGTGKTLLAKAIAGEANVPFFSISGSEFDEMYVGVGPARVRSLFKMAKNRSPCIIFIDELDSVGSKRSIRPNSSNDESKKTLNQLLVEMDGFNSNSKIIVLGATNCPEVLDNALLRPGRFDRKIEISLPDKKDRKEIFNLYLSTIKLNEDKGIKEYASRLANITPGFSGADIANLVNEAAIISARENKTDVDMQSFDKASVRVLTGFEMSKTLSKTEKRIVAFHESGHCVINWFSYTIFPVIKISIIPRSKGMLGFNMNLPSNSYLHTKQNLLDMITSTLGGRLAEEIFLGITTTGASDDLVKANDLARQMVITYGMSKLGLISYRTHNENYNSMMMHKEYSEQREREIEDEIKEIIDQCTVKAKQTLMQQKDKLYSLVNSLLEKETLGEEELKEILGQRPLFSDVNMGHNISALKH